MTIDITLATRDDADTLVRLWPLYQYDMSEVGGLPINAYGLFEDDDARYADYKADLEPWWRSPGRLYPFLIRVDGRAAGFAFVKVTAGVTSIIEFFVMRGFRRQGVARKVVLDLLARFPDLGQIGAYHLNTPAIAFWRQVLREAVGGGVSESRELVDGDDMVVFRFERKAM